jgi:hypothetical protein
MITGGIGLSYRKQDLADQKSGAIGFTKLSFSHKAAQGETGLNLLALNMPPELAANGLANPSGSELLNTNLLVYKNNLTIVSSVRGLLQHGVSYIISSSSQINFLNFTTNSDEIFTGTLDYAPTSGVRVVDGQAITVSGILSATSTDFAVGQPFVVGKYPNANVGAVMVFLDGVLQKRNTGNSATVKDGAYCELDLGNGLGSVIRFNSTFGTAKSVLVVSNGLLCDRPDGSLVASLERLQGQVNNLAGYLAPLANTTMTSVLGAAPTYLDLKAFGDRVIQLESGTAIIAGDKTFSGNVNFSSSNYLKLPSGTTASRPSEPSEGMVRFNSTSSQFEGYSKGSWNSFQNASCESTAITTTADALLASNFYADGTGSRTITINNLAIGQSATILVKGAANTVITIQAFSDVGITPLVVKYGAGQNGTMASAYTLFSLFRTGGSNDWVVVGPIHGIS